MNPSSTKKPPAESTLTLRDVLHDPSLAIRQKLQHVCQRRNKYFLFDQKTRNLSITILLLKPDLTCNDVRDIFKTSHKWIDGQIISSYVKPEMLDNIVRFLLSPAQKHRRKTEEETDEIAFKQAIMVIGYIARDYSDKMSISSKQLSTLIQTFNTPKWGNKARHSFARYFLTYCFEHNFQGLAESEKVSESGPRTIQKGLWIMPGQETGHCYNLIFSLSCSTLGLEINSGCQFKSPQKLLDFWISEHPESPVRWEYGVPSLFKGLVSIRNAQPDGSAERQLVDESISESMSALREAAGSTKQSSTIRKTYDNLLTFIPKS